jgi:hypothetical protein
MLFPPARIETRSNLLAIGDCFPKARNDAIGLSDSMDERGRGLEDLLPRRVTRDNVAGSR